MNSLEVQPVPNLTRVREIRNKYISIFEKAIILLSVLLMILGVAIAITDISFISKDVWSNGLIKMDGGETLIFTNLMYMLAITCFFAYYGIVISKRPACHSGYIAIYGVLIFTLVMLPLMIEGVVFMKLSHIEDSEIENYCDVSKQELNRENNIFVVSFFVNS